MEEVGRDKGEAQDVHSEGTGGRREGRGEVAKGH